MNNDLIRREDAIRAGHEIPELIFNHYFGQGDVEALMNAIPVVDAEPVRHGRWYQKRMSVPKGKGQTYLVWACSLCHKHEKKRSDYCPNCGAKMDGDVDEQ